MTVSIVSMLKSVDAMLVRASECKNIDLMKSNVENANAIISELIAELTPPKIDAPTPSDRPSGGSIPSDIL